jgi:hypothetical protein
VGAGVGIGVGAVVGGGVGPCDGLGLGEGLAPRTAAVDPPPSTRCSTALAGRTMRAATRLATTSDAALALALIRIV